MGAARTCGKGLQAPSLAVAVHCTGLPGAEPDDKARCAEPVKQAYGRDVAGVHAQQRLRGCHQATHDDGPADRRNVGSGRKGRRFESSHRDQENQRVSESRMIPLVIPGIARETRRPSVEGLFAFLGAPGRLRNAAVMVAFTTQIRRFEAVRDLLKAADAPGIVEFGWTASTLATSITALTIESQTHAQERACQPAAANSRPWT